MRISIIKAKKINNIILPSKVEGSYLIDDVDNNGIRRNLISVEADNGKWKLISNKDVYYINKGMMEPYVYLEKGKFYFVHNDIEKEDLMLYCSNVLTEYNYYDISNSLEQGISIGSSQNALITYSIIEENAAYIKRINNKIYIVDNNTKYGIYVNDVRVNNQKEIKVGDVIFILGMKMILNISKDNNGENYHLCINNSPNIQVKLMSTSFIPANNNPYDESDEETEYPLYDEKEYFHKTPRFISNIKPLILNVDAPPAKQEEQNNPMLLTIGPMLTMSMTSMVTGYTAINNVLSGNTTWDKALPSLIICGAMIASVFVWPMFTKSYQKKLSKEQERKRQTKYSNYIESKRKEIVSAKQEQANILNNNFPPLQEVLEVILKRRTGLWQRRLEDDDYLKVSLGIGTYPMQIDIKYPEDHFSMVEDNLKNMVSELGKEPKLLPNVPVVFSFIENYISGLIGEEQLTGEYMRRLLIQILAYHSYDNLKIVILTDEEHEYQWKFLKNIPHLFTDDKSLRFFATNSDEYKEVCYYLEKVFQTRMERFKSGEVKLEDLKQTYLIITDNLKKIRDFDVIKHILENKKNYGFSLFVLDKKITNLPDQCTTFINVTKEKGSLQSNSNYNEPIDFNIDLLTEIDYEECALKLANIPIEIKNNEEGQLPNKLGFLEMFDVGKIEQLNSNTRWTKSNPMLNLQVPVGIGKNGEKISIDLHEKYHGPHGLIAGMTGSGKSEFIITYILSMAINYHPYEVQFILIDYKGGGLAGAFENKNTGLKLPHLVGTITNLDANEIKRSLASIESELKRRQALFNKAREISGESTIDIYKYQRMYREGVVDTPVSHLFIISDEFAELKNQEPEFMAQLISTARIGRSLGVHLILATQKPSGVVDPQIWSNTRFRVCMRVQDKSDSNEVIKCPDAAFLKQTGRFYFQVGYNEVFVLGQAAWAGGKYVPSPKVNRTIDTSLNFIDNIGYSIKNVETKEKKEVLTESKGEELINIVKYLDNLAKEENISCRPLWLDKIPEFIKVEDLSKKYNYQKEDYVIDLIIGEYDIPSRQEQALLTVPISREGNTLVYGASGSGKENFITTLIYSSMLYYTPNELNYYVIDFGSEALKMFDKSPLVGNILNVDDEEKIKNLYKMLSSTMEERKKLFAEYNGDYYTYCKNSGKSVPNIVVVINNFESYQETYGDKYDEILNILTRDANKYGIYFILTLNTPNGIRFKLKQNFSLTYVLNQNNEDDYTSILGNIHKTYPSKLFGRGIIKTDDVYEFQTAMATNKDDIPKFIKALCEEYNSKYDVEARKIPTLPEYINYQVIENDYKNQDEIIIGIDKDSLDIVTCDFDKNYATMVTSLDLNGTETFLNPLIKQIASKNKSSLVVINAEDYYIEEPRNYQYVDQQFNEIFTSLTNFVTTQNDLYVKNNYNREIFEGKKPISCIIIGIDSFKNRLSSENKLKFDTLFTTAKDLGIINFIIVDSVDKIKKVEFESWYKTAINNTNGIWLGNGINDQFSLKLSSKLEEMKKEIPTNFCFVVNRGIPKYVKFIENFEVDDNKIESLW